MSIIQRLIVPLAAALIAVNDSATVCLGVTIQFRSQANVSKPFIQLGDIAEITNGTPEDIALYQQIKLAPSPPSGGECLLDFDSVRNRLLALGYSSGELEFTGASRVLVTGIDHFSSETAQAKRDPYLQTASYEESADTQSRTQAERTLRQILRNELKPTLTPTELALAEFQVEIDNADAAKLAGTSSLDWNARGWSDALDQPHQLVLTRKDARGSASLVHVNCLVKMPPKTLTVKNHLPVGHVIAAADLEWTYSRQGGDPISINQVVGMETKHALRPGNSISPGDLRVKPYVRSRDLVTVKARQGRIVVKRTMRALGTAGLGESVELVSLEGKDRFTAQVTGFHEAEVLETQSGQGP